MARVAYLLFFISPFYLITIPLPIGGSFNVLDLCQVILILATGFYLYNHKTANGLPYFLRSKIFLLFWIALFLIGIFISYGANATAENWTDGLGILKSYFILPILSALCLAYFVLNQKISAQTLFVSYFFYSSSLAIIGLFYLFSQKLSYDGRLEIFFNSPNFLALALSPGIVIGLFFGLVRFKKTGKTSEQPHEKNFFITQKKSLLLLVLLLAQIICLFKTQSLGAVLGILAATFFLCSLLFLKKKSFNIVALSIIFLIALLNIDFLLHGFDYAPQIPPDSFDSRITVYQSATTILKDHWLLGIGPGNFQKEYLAYQQYFPPYPQWAIPHSHNALLHIWVEGGLLSVLGFIFLLKKKFSYSRLSYGHILALSVLVYFLVHGLVDMSLWKNDLAMLFWILILLPE